MEAATLTRAPDRSLEQRRAGLERANHIRSYRATVKRHLKAGRVDVRALVLDPPDEMLSMPVFAFLIAMPKWGRVKANRALCKHRISPSKTLGGLSERQRRELAGGLAGK